VDRLGLRQTVGDMSGRGPEDTRRGTPGCCLFETHGSVRLESAEEEAAGASEL